MASSISRELAAARAARVSALKYSLSLSFPEDLRLPVHGALDATFDLSDTETPLIFDFRPPADAVHAVVVNGEMMRPAHDGGQIRVPAERLRHGTNAVHCDFVAGADALHRQDGFVYSLFVPARASTVFPCFDQPDLKARWTVTLHIPHGWTAVSNGREMASTAAPDGVAVTFEETVPLPTYLLAIVAGRFAVEKIERRGRQFRMFHRETNPARLRENLADVMERHADALAQLEAYTGIPYPFGKFDVVLIPSFQFSGMEHPGAVYYNAGAILLDGTATHAQHLARASVIAHEVAHMWFGDLVTMTWFDDVWTKEVFAGFFADKLVSPTFPDMDHDLRFLWQHYPGAYEVDRTAGAHPIRQPLENLRDAGSLYGPIIYQKAPIVMRQLEERMGAEGLREALQEYLTTYAMANASWPDLLTILEGRRSEGLASWSGAWIEQAGRPTITTVVALENDSILNLAFRQSDSRGRDQIWPQRLHVLLGYGADVRRIHVDIGSNDVVARDAIGLPAPDWILPDGGRLGYARFVLDARTLAFVTGSLHRLPDALTRGAALLTLWEAMLEGDVPVRKVWRQLLSALPHEPNPLNLQQMLEYTRTLFWRILSPDERQSEAPQLETVLRDGLTGAVDHRAKATWFSALRSMALTAATLEWLARLWRRQEEIAGLPLAESDDTELACELAVREAAFAETILRVQLDRLDDTDRKARFAFVAQALSPDALARDRFFESLRTPSNRVNESWTVEAIRCLHHPLRTDVPDSRIVAALSMVREIQETGDIFFPRRWAEAVLWGCQSKRTALAVRRFIDGLPDDYPRRLRGVLLASADLLFRHLDGRLKDD
jgi:aminopeptidase N